jgi:hypothetical protein
MDEKIREFSENHFTSPTTDLDKTLTPTALIRSSYVANESREFLIYGTKGWGKSSYALKILAQLYQTWEWEILKKYIVFSPDDFIKVMAALKAEDAPRQYALLWDDAGVWLSALKWNDPLLIAIVRYLDVCRVHWAAILFTTPFPTHVVKKVRGLPSAITIRIDKVNGNVNKPRKAVGYYTWTLPDLKKTRVAPALEDEFSAVLPNKLYNSYQEYRKGYAFKAIEEIEDRLYEANEKAKKSLAGKGKFMDPEPEVEENY